MPPFGNTPANALGCGIPVPAWQELLQPPHSCKRKVTRTARIGQCKPRPVGRVGPPENYVCPDQIDRKSGLHGLTQHPLQSNGSKSGFFLRIAAADLGMNAREPY